MADAAKWLKGEETVASRLWNGVPLIVYAPNTVKLTIIETDPGLKRRYHPAGGGKLGQRSRPAPPVEIRLFIQQGEKVKVDTRTGRGLARGGE